MVGQQFGLSPIETLRDLSPGEFGDMIEKRNQQNRKQREAQARQAKRGKRR